MPGLPLRAFGAAALVALAACESDTIPPSSAPALAPGTPVVTSGQVVTTAPVVTTVPGAVASPPPAAVPIMPGAGTSAMPLAAPGRISATEIGGLIGGNTITGVANDGSTYHAWFGPNGRLSFRQGSFSDSGSWRIGADGRFCTAMTKVNGGAEECYLLYRTSMPGTLRFDRLDGTNVGTFAVLPGNPQAL